MYVLYMRYIQGVFGISVNNCRIWFLGSKPEKSPIKVGLDIVYLGDTANIGFFFVSRLIETC